MDTEDGVGTRFVLRDGYAFYEGPVTDGGVHRHAAFQIAVGEREITMLDEAGTVHRSAVLVVPPMVRHRLLAADRLRTFFVEPHSAFADRLRERCGPGVTAVPELCDLGEDEVRAATARPSSGLDARLVAAMNTLAAERITMPELAARVGLSPQRLRALARRELGMPLARWRIWQRLVRAAEALGEGRSLADAAVTGGFADQAHFHRQLREMMGITPSAVLPVLRPSPGVRRTPRSSP